MASSRDVLPWNLQFKPFLGKSCPSSILERRYHLSEQFKHVGKKCIDSFQRPFPKPRLCICPKNAKHCDQAATFLKRWKKHAKVIHFQSKGFLPSKTGNRCNSFPFRRFFLQQCNLEPQEIQSFFFGRKALIKG